MRAKIYERYYKFGFSHDLFKSLHLKKPKKSVKKFYYALIAIIVVTALLLS